MDETTSVSPMTPHYYYLLPKIIHRNKNNKIDSPKKEKRDNGDKISELKKKEITFCRLEEESSEDEADRLTVDGRDPLRLVATISPETQKLLERDIERERVVWVSLILFGLIY